MLIRFYIPMHILFQGMPLIGFCVTSIYAAHSFRKQKSIAFNRCAYIYLFSMYMLFAYYLIIRPFAGFSLVAAMTTPTMQLVPFHALADFVQNSGFVLADASTWFSAFTGVIFRGIVLNVLLFVPIGLFIRGVCGASVKKTLLISFLICLFFELTQLSGLYFIYPRPYRIFDVDDFIANLLGGWLGAIIAAPVFRHLPSSGPLDGRLATQGNEVPLLRRGIAMVIDQVLMLSSAFLLANAIWGVTDGDFLRWSFRDEGAMLAIYFPLALAWAAIQQLSGGRTLGLWLCGLRLISSCSARLCFWQCIVRSLVFAAVWLLPSLTFTLISAVHYGGFHLAPIALVFEAFILCIEVYCGLSIALGAITQSTSMPYDRLSKTKFTTT